MNIFLNKTKQKNLDNSFRHQSDGLRNENE